MNNYISPQTRAFHKIFPKNNQISPLCDLAELFREQWETVDTSYEFIGVSSETPEYNHSNAERVGIDYCCKILAHFKSGKIENTIPFGSIPYPNNNGEFVINGNRYVIPMFLYTPMQYEKLKKKFVTKDDPVDIDKEKFPHTRDINSLHVLLIDELIQIKLSNWFQYRFKRLITKLSGENLNVRCQLIKMSSSILKTGNHCILHNFIHRFGQLVDKSNPLSRISQQKELSFYGLCGVHPDAVADFGLRDVSDDDIYKICPVQTPQGHRVGLRLFLARNADVNFKTKMIISSKNNQPGDLLSDAASLIPFIEHDDISRGLMGANMMKQALPLESPEYPLIQTGWEKEIVKRNEISENFVVENTLSLGKNLFAAYLPYGLKTFEDGIVISESASKALKYKKKKTFWFILEKNKILNSVSYKSIVTKKNQKLFKSDKKNLDRNGIIKIGTNVKSGDVLISSITQIKNTIDKRVLIDTLYAQIETDTKDIKDNSIRLPHNFYGIVTEIIDSNSEPLINLPSDVSRKIGVTVERSGSVQVGDKISIRHGGKGVVTSIKPDKSMPYVKTNENYCGDSECNVQYPHRHIQIALNPMGVTGRLNVGQLFETGLGKIAEKQNTPITVNPFKNTWDIENISNELKSINYSHDGKEQLFISQGKEELPLHYRTLTGPIYCLRLHQLSEDKIQGRGRGKPYDYTQRDNQPLRGKRLRWHEVIGGGQRIGEMETWALSGYGAWYILDELLNYKSDNREIVDIDGVFKEQLRRPQVLVNLILIFRSMMVDFCLEDSQGNNVTQQFLEKPRGVNFQKVSVCFAQNEDSKQWNISGEVKKSDPNYDPEGLLSEHIFSTNWKMGLIKFADKITNPLYDIVSKKFKKDTEDAIENFMIDSIPVLPINFRNERFEFGSSFQNDLNILYASVVKSNNWHKKILEDKKAKQDEIEKRKKRLEYAVKSLFFGKNIYGKKRKGLIEILHGKKGLIRGHMAGKRVDYSGRAVIVGDPTLPLDEAGIPEKLWNAFFPDIDKTNKPLILLNRQPSLHRYSFLAFHASYHSEGNVIRMNPFVCKPFNADFDGDAIAIHVPRGKNAISEAERMVPSKNLLSQSRGDSVLGFSKDIILGVIYITYHCDINSDKKIPFTEENNYPISDKNVWEIVTVDNIKTTVGRLLLRRVTGPISIKNISFDDNYWKETLEKIIQHCVQNEQEFIHQFTKKLSLLVDNALLKSGLSLSITDFNTPIDLEKREEIPSFLWFMRNAGIYSESIETQIIKERGRMRYPDPGKEELTDKIKSNLIIGHNEKEYLISGHGARAGLVDKGLITAHSGRLLREWIYKLQHLYIVEEDCNSNEGLLAYKFDGEPILNYRFEADEEGSLLSKINQSTIFRSPITCKARDNSGFPGICQKCYGHDPSTGKVPEIALPVGILAAQALGERVGQETLKSFHTGGGKSKEKVGLELIKLLKKEFKNKQDTEKLLKKIYEVFSQSSRPRLIHFEVLLRGILKKKTIKNLLSELAFSQGKTRIANSIMTSNEEIIFGIISRIVSGQIIGTGPMKG